MCRLQVFWYFPLEHQINQLLKNKKYTYALKYEGRRSQNARYMSDVYDSPRWQEVAGTMTGDRVTRIVVQLCVDAFPWSSRKHQVFLLLISFFLPTFHFFFKLNGRKFKLIQIPNGVAGLGQTLVECAVESASMDEIPSRAYASASDNPA